MAIGPDVSPRKLILKLQCTLTITPFLSSKTDPIFPPILSRSPSDACRRNVRCRRIPPFQSPPPQSTSQPSTAHSRWITPFLLSNYRRERQRERKRERERERERKEEGFSKREEGGRKRDIAAWPSNRLARGSHYALLKREIRRGMRLRIHGWRKLHGSLQIWGFTWDVRDLSRKYRPCLSSCNCNAWINARENHASWGKSMGYLALHASWKPFQRSHKFHRT